MFKKVYSGSIMGVRAYLVNVEVDVSDGLPGFSMVGYLSSEVKEAQDRVRTAIRNSGFRFPPKKVTVNLSPADIRKDGTGYDLPIAVSILAALGFVDSGFLENRLFLGELSLDGRVQPVKGVLPVVHAAKEAGIVRCFLPEQNVKEGRLTEGMEIVGVSSLIDLIGTLKDEEKLKRRCQREERHSLPSSWEYQEDFKDVNGQKLLRRATEVAAAGNHNILYIGGAGTGKTMTARRIPSILPKMTMEEAIEVTKIYSICGLLPESSPLLEKRPFRAPHHTISVQALIGGGRNPRPGEMSLAHKGVLFLDELPEFSRGAIEVLRQPLEEGKVRISRMRGAFEFPAECMTVAAMNPCPCGYYPDFTRCRCTEGQIKKYMAKVSKPIRQRFDICAEAAPLSFEEIKKNGRNESSEKIRKRVEAARQIQAERFQGSGISGNSQMHGEELERYCRLGKQEELFLDKIYTRMQLSPRGYHKVLKVARTIADLEESREIGIEHLAEAVSYRKAEEKYWET